MEDLQDRPELYYKLKDMQVLYQGFFQLSWKGILLPRKRFLRTYGCVAEKSRKLKDSVVVLDGYTGFTPIQQQLLKKLLQISSQVYSPVTTEQGKTLISRVALISCFI